MQQHGFVIVNTAKETVYGSISIQFNYWKSELSNDTFLYILIPLLVENWGMGEDKSGWLQNQSLESTKYFYKLWQSTTARGKVTIKSCIKLYLMLDNLDQTAFLNVFNGFLLQLMAFIIFQ